jgi:hypothetical protein
MDTSQGALFWLLLKPKGKQITIFTISNCKKVRIRDKKEWNNLDGF